MKANVFSQKPNPRRCLTKPMRGHSCLCEHQHFFPTQGSNQRKRRGTMEPGAKYKGSVLS